MYIQEVPRVHHYIMFYNLDHNSLSGALKKLGIFQQTRIYIYSLCSSSLDYFYRKSQTFSIMSFGFTIHALTKFTIDLLLY